MDYSHGKADLDTWGAKLRFDWLNAFSANDWNFTPYTSLTYTRSKLDAYTETGGGFPASFNEVKDHNTVLRIGLDGVHSLTNDIRLLTRAEAAYRFEDETAATSGTITGLSASALLGRTPISSGCAVVSAPKWMWPGARHHLTSTSTRRVMIRPCWCGSAGGSRSDTIEGGFCRHFCCTLLRLWVALDSLP